MILLDNYKFNFESNVEQYFIKSDVSHCYIPLVRHFSFSLLETRLTVYGMKLNTELKTPNSAFEQMVTRQCSWWSSGMKMHGLVSINVSEKHRYPMPVHVV
jgi:hypothetical protein